MDATRGERRLQHEAVVTVHLATETPSVDGTQRVGFEDEDYFDDRWWPVDEITCNAKKGDGWLQRRTHHFGKLGFHFDGEQVGRGMINRSCEPPRASR